MSNAYKDWILDRAMDAALDYGLEKIESYEEIPSGWHFYGPIDGQHVYVAVNQDWEILNCKVVDE